MLADFGAALQCSEHTQEVTMGAFSPGYAAPEQVLCPGKAGPWTDIYSLSATWYELLTGQRPEMLSGSAANGKPRRVGWTPCPAALRESILRNLSPNPSDRYQSGVQWLGALRKGCAEPGMLRRRRLLGGGCGSRRAAGRSGGSPA